MTEAPPDHFDHDLSNVLALVALLSDPAAAKARIQALAAQQKTLEEVTVALNEARAGHEQARTNILSATNASKERLASESAAHVAACAERSRALDAREARIAATEAETAEERKKAQSLRSDLVRRLAAVNAAARDAAA
jgi:chromosome segregation ATPase